MKHAGRKISAFVLILAAVIYFVRPGLRPIAMLSPEASWAQKGSERQERSSAARSAKAQPSEPLASSQLTAAREPASNVTATKSLQAVLEEDLLCYKSEACDFPKTDPRSYSFALGRKSASDLVKYFHTEGRSNLKEARALADDFLDIEDGFVQEAAMQVLGELPPDTRSLRAVSKLLAETTDPSLVVQAMDELHRYMGSGEEGEVHRALGILLQSGARLAAEKASERILPFLTPQNQLFYQRIRASLPADSQVARNLKAALDESQRISTGG